MPEIVFALFAILVSSNAADLVKRQVALTPTCGQPLYTGITNENSQPGTVILRTSASSPVGNQLVWSIQDTTFQRFSVNPATGDVSVAGSLARAALQRSAIEFRVRATDNNNQLYCESIVRINVLPSATSITQPPFGSQPYFAQSTYPFNVGSVTYGTVVGQVGLANTNGGYVTYSISGTSSFTINSQTGQISANGNLQPGIYTFTVNAQTSNGTPSTTVTVQVTSGGSTQLTPPSFSQSSYNVQVSGCTTGTSVAQVQAGGSATTPTQYSLSGTALFAIDPNSGFLTAAQNLSSGSYTFQIFATSAGGQATATVTAVVTCPTQPSSNQYYFTSGSCPAGTQLGSICANNIG